VPRCTLYALQDVNHINPSPERGRGNRAEALSEATFSYPKGKIAHKPLSPLQGGEEVS